MTLTTKLLNVKINVNSPSEGEKKGFLEITDYKRIMQFNTDVSSRILAGERQQPLLTEKSKAKPS